MKNRLRKLSKLLHRADLISEAKAILKLSQSVEEPAEWDEAWHEESVKEFPEELEPKDKDLSEVALSVENAEENVESIKHMTRELVSKVSAKHNVVIVLSSRGFLLGSGAYGGVFSGVYKNKPVAVKIALNPFAQREVKNWKFILERINSFPPEVQKHIPQIYLAENGRVTDEDSFNELNYEIIVMEELKKLPTKLQNLMMPGFKNPVELIEKHFDLESFRRYMNIARRGEGELKIGLDFKEKLIDKFRGLDRLEEDLLKQMVRDILKSDIETQFFVGSRMLEYYYNEFLPKIKSSVPGKEPGFPINDEDYEELERSGTKLPDGFESFTKALVYLKGEGIEWSDLHDQNVMIGADDELKFIDLGFWLIR